MGASQIDPPLDVAVTLLALSRNALLRWGTDGRLVAQGARSAHQLTIDHGDIELLHEFVRPIERAEVIERRLRGELDRERREVLRADLASRIDAFVGIGVLLATVGGEAVRAGFFAQPERQLPMLWDAVRMNAYRRTLERVAPGNVLVELGCGHGVLACLAVRAGARRVYAIEETSMIEIAREIARVNRIDDRVVFVEGNSLDVELDEAADVVYGDLMGPDPLGAGILVYARDASARLLRPGGVLVPSRLSVFAVGVDSSRVASEVDTARRWLRRAEGLSDAFGLDLSPLASALRDAFGAAYETFSYKELLETADRPSSNADVILTREAPISEFELKNVNPSSGSTLVPFSVVRDGTLNAVATYAVVQLDDETSLSTSPYAEERPSAWGGQFLSTVDPLSVVAGTTIDVDVAVNPWMSPAVSYRLPSPTNSATVEALFNS